jgi:hypothetical protein
LGVPNRVMQRSNECLTELLPAIIYLAASRDFALQFGTVPHFP